MTRPLSALLAAVFSVGLGLTAQAQSDHDAFGWSSSTNSTPDYLPLVRPASPTMMNPFVMAPPTYLETAPVPAWLFGSEYAHPAYRDIMQWSSTRPETWGVEAAPYQVRHSGATQMGLIPQPIPEGWVVTNRCLEWDDSYTSPERPLGNCYVFEMRPMLISLFSLR